MNEMVLDEVTIFPEIPQEDKETIEQNPERNELAAKWKRRLEFARKHWAKYHKRCRYNRKIVKNVSDEADPNSEDFNIKRANLIQGTISALVPVVYARAPEISVIPKCPHEHQKAFAQTLQDLINMQLKEANLKEIGKDTVRSCVTTSIGAVKVIWQDSIYTNPMLKKRLDDAQDNLQHIDNLLTQLEEGDDSIEEYKAKREELILSMQSLEKQVEASISYGIAIDHVLIDDLLIDPTVREFSDYPNANWIAQKIPMMKADAEAQFKKKIKSANLYKLNEDEDKPRFTLGEDGQAEKDEDTQVIIWEIWDKQNQTVYTIAEGCDYFLRDPYTPEYVGARFYPFFLLPYSKVDGEFWGPSIVDLTEKLQDEHNTIRDKLVEHRNFIKPGYFVGSDVKEKDIKTIVMDNNVGSLTQLSMPTENIRNAMVPKTYPPIDPTLYDTTQVREDWEQTTGLQDAMRSSVNQAKTATEAQILQNSLTGRTAEFMDTLESWITDIAKYVAQIFVTNLDASQVLYLLGKDDPTEIVWEQMDRETAFQRVTINVVAGTSGAPNKASEQETWGKILPTISQLLGQIMQMSASGMDPKPFVNLMRETVRRFDDRIEVEQFLPAQIVQMQTQPGQMPMVAQQPGAAAQQQLPPELMSQLAAAVQQQPQ
ncbi:hypothetical protein [Parasutterella secunda]|uniref:Portal protein n=1 Tax=Parasutterella secunda TaxID=626947 RepID=A0ABS2GRV3_9BURK|nr:hypothetical protein [Parasutterella secunda]MBM6928174.1 hypothetical protein [Parasutterella secunda]